MRAGIEQTTIIREWRTALANAIQNGFPIADDWLSPTAARRRQFSICRSSPSPQIPIANAYRLLNTEFENMKQLSNNYVALRQSMQFIAPDSLANDPLNQKFSTVPVPWLQWLATDSF